MDKVKHVQIHLMPEALERAKQALGATCPVGYPGPLFIGVEECEIEDGVVHVLIDDVGYVYPLHTVARLKVWLADTPTAAV